MARYYPEGCDDSNYEDYEKPSRSDCDEPDAPKGYRSRKFFCEICMAEHTSKFIDEGIGAYEFWGSKEMHHDWIEVCPACEEAVPTDALESEEDYKQHQLELHSGEEDE